MLKRSIIFLAAFAIYRGASASLIDLHEGGRSVVCGGVVDPVNSTLVAEVGKAIGLTPANLGATFEDSVNAIVSRVTRFNPNRALRIRNFFNTFWSNAQRLRNIELNSTAWPLHAKYLGNQCKLQRVIIERPPKRLGDKRYLVNDDLFLKLTPSAQATLIFELGLIQELRYIHDISVSEFKEFLALVISQAWSTQTLANYINKGKQVPLPTVDLNGAEVALEFDFESKIPYARMIAPFHSRYIVLQSKQRRVGSSYSAEIAYDPNDYSITRVQLADIETFKLHNGDTVVLSGWTNFKNEIPLTGILAQRGRFHRFPDSHDVVCQSQLVGFPFQKVYANFNENGQVLSCWLGIGEVIGERKLIQNEIIKFEANIAPKTGYVARDGSGVFSVKRNFEGTHNIYFSSMATATIADSTENDVYDLKIKRVETLQKKYNTYRDALLYGANLKEGVIVSVYAAGSLASIELKKSISVGAIKTDRYGYADQNVKLAISGRCPGRPGKIIRGFITLHEESDSPSEFYIRETIIAEKRNIAWSYSITKSDRLIIQTVPEYSKIQLDRYGNLLEHLPICE